MSCSGHAMYDKKGRDIVCAAASVLVINTLNAIEKLTDTKVVASSDATNGNILAVFSEPLDGGARLLLDAMVMGLEEIKRQYGKRYISFQVREVESC